MDFLDRAVSGGGSPQVRPRPAALSASWSGAPIPAAPGPEPEPRPEPGPQQRLTQEPGDSSILQLDGLSVEKVEELEGPPDTVRTERAAPARAATARKPHAGRMRGAATTRAGQSGPEGTATADETPPEGPPEQSPSQSHGGPAATRRAASPGAVVTANKPPDGAFDLDPFDVQPFDAARLDASPPTSTPRRGGRADSVPLDGGPAAAQAPPGTARGRRNPRDAGQAAAQAPPGTARGRRNPRDAGQAAEEAIEIGDDAGPADERQSVPRSYHARHRGARAAGLTPDSRALFRVPAKGSSPETVVHVSIGRIDVRADRPTKPAPSGRPRPPGPSSLDDYLRRRDEARR